MNDQFFTLRSLIEPDGLFRLFRESAKFPQPHEDEVLVEVEAAPVNSSDLGAMLGPVDPDSFEVVGEGLARELRGRVPVSALASVSARIGKPLQAGLEGAGRVVVAGHGAADLLGRRVSIFGGAMYASHRIARRSECMVMPDEVGPAAASAAYVNPMTVLAMIETGRRHGSAALINTAAASNLGRMLVRACAADGIGLVNIVRSEEQAALLRAEGAQWVCDLASPAFDRDLAGAIARTGAFVAFDAIGGGEIGSRILSAMEAAASLGGGEYQRYGSAQRKRLFIYGGLDRSPTVIRRTFGMAWEAGGWLLGTALDDCGIASVEAMKQRVTREIGTIFASRFEQELSVNGLLDPDVMRHLLARKTGGKALLMPKRADR